MKGSRSKRNISEISARKLFARAAVAEEQAKLARKDARSAKAKYKEARKTYKLAKQAAKAAHKEAKAAAKTLRARTARRTERFKRAKPKAQQTSRGNRSAGTRPILKEQVGGLSPQSSPLSGTTAQAESVVSRPPDSGLKPLSDSGPG